VSRKIDLLVPGLCGPLPGLDGLQDDKSLTSVVSLLEKASKQPIGNLPYAEQLCDLMGLPSAGVPHAKLSLAGFGIEVDGFQWMHADPVYLQADLDHAVLYDSDSLQLDPGEAVSLVAALNHHFEHDGVEFVIADASHWFVRSVRPLDVSTTCLDDVIMQNVNQFFPAGADQVFCKQLLNESQMLLHTDPVNQQREARGSLPVNSIWLWGEGRSGYAEEDGSRGSETTRCFGNDMFLRGVAKCLDVEHEEIDDIDVILGDITGEDKALIVFNDLRSACNYGDVDSWQQDFSSLFERYLDPLLAHVLSNKIDLKLYPCNGYMYLINSKTKHRFWRRGTLEKHFESNNTQA